MDLKRGLGYGTAATPNRHERMMLPHLHEDVVCRGDRPKVSRRNLGLGFAVVLVPIGAPRLGRGGETGL